jgi:molybdate transport system regulatory protein
MASLSLRIDLDTGARIGPGKIALLRAIDETGSISAAGRSLGMSYRRAWQLIDELNAASPHPVIAAQTGGRSGGGAALTAFGQQIVAHYVAIETESRRSATRHLKALQTAMRKRR